MQDNFHFLECFIHLTLAEYQAHHDNALYPSLFAFHCGLLRRISVLSLSEWKLLASLGWWYNLSKEFSWRSRRYASPSQILIDKGSVDKTTSCHTNKCGDFGFYANLTRVPLCSMFIVKLILWCLNISNTFFRFYRLYLSTKKGNNQRSWYW